MQSSSLRFSESVRVLSDAARRLGWVVPAFRSPPQRPDVDRALRRRGDGHVTIAVRLAGRPFAAVQADLIDALLIVNEIVGADAQSSRRSLWNALALAGQVDGSPALLAA
ncbi:MAG: hypothetical protein K1X38_09835 [Microthrixaceae bacterium]|nr:hypothetical protein [Microthrixaceae bacterium]